LYLLWILLLPNCIALVQDDISLLGFVNMESSATSTSNLSTAQRVAFKRAQVLTEMNETIHTLSSIETVLDEINRTIQPIAVDRSSMNESKHLSDDYLMNVSKSSPKDTTTSVSQKMHLLMIELEKWEEI
jgi:hypothetical protein